MTTWLVVSNLGLLLLVAYLWRHPADAGRVQTVIVTQRVSSASSGMHRSVGVTHSNSVPAFRWTQLETDDYRAYIDRLRSVGCPEQTIRDLIIADIDKLYAPQLAAIHPGGRQLNYWQPDDKELESSEDHRERLRKQREIDFAKRQILHELLGVDLVAERSKSQAGEDAFGRRLGFLPEGKRSQVRMALEHYNDAEVAVRQKTWEEGDSLTEGDQLRLKELQQQKDTLIADILTPEERERFEMAMSPLAYKVRDSLFSLNPTEQEYQALYTLQKEFVSKNPEGVPLTAEQQAEQDKAWQEMQGRIKETLGDERYGEYVRAQDPEYRGLAAAASRYKIPADKVAEVYDYKRIAAEYRLQVAQDATLNLEQKTAAMAAIADETERSVRSTLGEKAFRYYTRNGRGGWIREGQGAAGQ